MPVPQYQAVTVMDIFNSKTPVQFVYWGSMLVFSVMFTADFKFIWPKQLFSHQTKTIIDIQNMHSEQWSVHTSDGMHEWLHHQ